MNDWNRPQDPQPGPPAPQRQWTAAEKLLVKRRFQRWVPIAFIGVIVAPIAMFVVLGLFFTSDSGSIDSPLGIAFTILTFVFVGLLGLFFAAMPILIPAAIVAALIYAWRRQRNTAPPPSADFRAAQAPAGTTTHVPSPDAPPMPWGKPQPAFGTLDLEAEPALKAELAGLEAARADLANQISRRVRIFVPLGLAAGLAIGLLLANSSGTSKGSPIAVVLVLTAMGLGAGFIYANSGGERAAYAKTFKDRIMPLWLARYGALRYGPGALPDLSRLSALGLVPPYVKGQGEDEIAGTYREHRLRRNEVALIGPPRNKEEEPVVYRGLIVELWVRKPYLSTTAVIDNSLEARFQTLRQTTMQPVGLGQGGFERLYRVYGTDQVAARAVLTPTVMERLMTLSDGHGFYPPHLLAEGERIVLSFPYEVTTNLFEPPDLTANNVVAQLAGQHRELDEIFKLIDAVIDTQILVRSA